MTPVDIQSVPRWPQYSKDKPKLMEFGSTLKMVDVPDRDRKQLVKDILLAARQKRIEDEKLTECPNFEEQKSVKVVLAFLEAFSSIWQLMKTIYFSWVERLSNRFPEKKLLLRIYAISR